MRFLLVLLLAAPLSAQVQSTTLVAPIENIVNVEPTPFVIQVQSCDSTCRQDRRDAADRQTEVIAQILADRPPASRVVRVGQGAVVFALLWAVYEFRQYRQKEDVPDTHETNVDNSTTVNNPPHSPHDHSGEGDGHR